MRDAVLIGHILVGVLGLILGPLAWLLTGPAGRRCRAGYDGSVAVVALTAVWLVAFDPARLWWLVPVAAATWGAALGGRWVVGHRPDAVRARVHLLGGSYVALVTGLSIGLSGNPVAWVLPALLAQPFLLWTDHHLTRRPAPRPPPEVTVKFHPDDSTDRRRVARERVDASIWLAVHALAFAGVNLGIAVAQGFQPEQGVFWGWGIGLAAHAALGLGRPPRWRERLVDRELTRTR